MKKAIILFGIIAVAISLCACADRSSGMFKSDQSIANSNFEELLQAIQSGKKEYVISLFSIETKRNSSDFEESVDALMKYYEGEYTTYDDWGGPVVEKSSDEEYESHILDSTYDIKTSEGDYRIAIRYIYEDTENPSNRGISSMYIIKAEDDLNLNYAYWGGAEDFTPGIHIGVVSEE